HAAHRLVVLGSGWAGFRLIQGLDTSLFEVTVVSPKNHFTFTPLLASSAVGTLEFRCVTEPVKRVPNLAFFEATCTRIDLLNRSIECASALEAFKGDSFAVNYDSLVIATGAVSNTFNIPGVKEHALFLKDVTDARKIRSKIMECFEHASQPNISESDRSKLLTLPSSEAAHWYSWAFDEKLSTYARDRFTRKGITLRLGEGVKEVHKSHFVLQSGTKVDYGMLVWSTGVGPVDLVKDLTSSALARDKTMGRIITDNHCRVLDANLKPIDRVYALGDCATIQDRQLPCTAQVANQKGAWLLKALNKSIKASPDGLSTFESVGVKPFEYNHMGSLAYIGKWRAVVDMSSPKSTSKTTESSDVIDTLKELVPKSGISAWLFWRSAYFTMSVSTKNKIMIPMYWFLTWIFGRDITRFH
ncbi:FAD/NAD(P)-binding domain-containing protein, partial [Rhizoclosmatium globosum]